MSYTQALVRGVNRDFRTIRNNMTTPMTVGNLVQWIPASAVVTGGAQPLASGAIPAWDANYFQTGYDAVLSNLTDYKQLLCGVLFYTGAPATGGVGLVCNYGFVPTITASDTVSVRNYMIASYTDTGTATTIQAPVLADTGFITGSWGGKIVGIATSALGGAAGTVSGFVRLGL